MRKEEKDVFFIVSRSGNKKPQVNFYDKEGKDVPKKDINVVYRESRSGQFVSKKYSEQKENPKTTPRGRDSKTGEFITVNEAHRRPNTTTVERVPRSSPVYFERNKKK